MTFFIVDVVKNVTLWYQIHCHGITVQISWGDVMVPCNVTLRYPTKRYAVAVHASWVDMVRRYDAT